MPFMDGLQTAAKIREVDPEAKLVMSTAVYDSPEVVQQHKEFGFQERVVKPYTMNDLYDALSRVLNQ